MIPWAKPLFFGNEKKLILDALDSTWVSGGKYVDEFETRLARLIGTKFAVTASNGTTALHLALLSAGVGPGDEVIVPGFTFVAPGNVTLHTGARPVFVDVHPDTWCIDVEEAKRNITTRTKAIIAVHIYGNVCDMDALSQIAADCGLRLIEDVAEAAFSKYGGRHAGSLGDLGCFSFQATKTITTGEGGAVLTNDEALCEQIKILRNHGMKDGQKYWHEVVGYNYRLTNLQAALGCAQLENLDRIIDEKKRVNNRYRQNLLDTPGIKFQKVEEKVEPVIWAVAIRIDPDYFKGNRDFLIAELMKREIETRPGFYPFSVMPLYSSKPLPVAETTGRHVISLPSYPSLTNDEIDRICGELVGLAKN